MSKKPSPPKPRRQFVAWLQAEIIKAGGKPPEPLTYAALQQQVETYLIRRQPESERAS